MLFEQPCPRNSEACRTRERKAQQNAKRGSSFSFFLVRQRLGGTISNMFDKHRESGQICRILCSFLNCEEGFIRTV